MRTFLLALVATLLLPNLATAAELFDYSQVEVTGGPLRHAAELNRDQLLLLIAHDAGDVLVKFLLEVSGDEALPAADGEDCLDVNLRVGVSYPTSGTLLRSWVKSSGIGPYRQGAPDGAYNALSAVLAAQSV